MEDTTTEKPVWPALKDSAIKDSAIKDSAIKDSAIKDMEADSSAIKDDADQTETLESKWYTWGLLRHGDCTMFEGARWTLYSNGNADFNATVTSGDDNDTWLIKEVRLLDSNGTVLGVLLNRYLDSEDHRTFYCNMPDSNFRYRFFAFGAFDRNLYPLIRAMNMRYSC
jgi:Family of unknown function (DUF6294)